MYLVPCTEDEEKGEEKKKGEGGEEEIQRKTAKTGKEATLKAREGNGGKKNKEVG